MFLILSIIIILLVLIWQWFDSFCYHEYMHSLEAYRQGATDIKIYPDFKNKTFYMRYYGDVKSKKLISLAGGFYTFLTLMPIAIICILLGYVYMYIPITTIAMVQFNYSLLEMKYIRNKEKLPLWSHFRSKDISKGKSLTYSKNRIYKFWRYTIYLLTLIVMSFIWLILVKIGYVVL